MSSYWIEEYENLLESDREAGFFKTTRANVQRDNFEGLGSLVGGLHDYEKLTTQQIEVQQQGAQLNADQQPPANTTSSPPSDQSGAY